MTTQAKNILVYSLMCYAFYNINNGADDFPFTILCVIATKCTPTKE